VLERLPVRDCATARPLGAAVCGRTEPRGPARRTGSDALLA